MPNEAGCLGKGMKAKTRRFDWHIPLPPDSFAYRADTVRGTDLALFSSCSS
jgi:hypothetical protein